MIKSKIITLLLIIGDLLLIILNYHLIGKLGAFTIDNTINTLDFISLLVTISIACFVPFLIKKAIDEAVQFFGGIDILKKLLMTIVELNRF